jgi:glucose 1-dehydrogenase
VRFGDKTVIVTGGGRGIGIGTAKKFAEEGASVVIGEIDAELGQNAADDLSDAGHRVAFVQVDVGDPNQAKNLVTEAVEKFGSVDVLVNNAGIIRTDDFLETDIETFDQVLRVNLRGVFLMTQAAARHMVAAGTKGSVVNICSITAFAGMPDQVGYCVSKAGVFQMTRSIGLALADKGIRVNAVGPGTVRTELSESALGYDSGGSVMKRVLARTPLGRLAEPEEIANAVLFLAGDDAGYLTGHTIFVDGGRLIQNIVLPFDE